MKLFGLVFWVSLLLWALYRFYSLYNGKIVPDVQHAILGAVEVIVAAMFCVAYWAYVLITTEDKDG